MNNSDVFLPTYVAIAPGGAVKYPTEVLGLVIVGAGPGGVGTLLAAHRAGKLEALLDSGVVVIEQTSQIGSGTIGTYAINSDSTGYSFVDCLASGKETPLTRLAAYPLTCKLEAAGEGAVALSEAAEFLSLVGGVIADMFKLHKTSTILARHTVLGVHQTLDGWSILVRDVDSCAPGNGPTATLMARSVLIATGAHQPAERLERDRVAGITLSRRYGPRLLQSDEALSETGLATISSRLAGKQTPRVAIIGGSTSAVSLANALLRHRPRIGFGQHGLTLLHRRPLRLYFPNRAAALAEGYTEWTEADICPVSGRVFRFAGLRLDSRELVMSARGVGGRPPEPRLRLHALQSVDPDAVRILDEADVVVAALGYRPRALPVFDEQGRAISLFCNMRWQNPMVDSECRVMDASGAPIPGLFGMGLAAGFLPRGRLGGEASFRGQANGLWLWQTEVGLMIADAALVRHVTAQGKRFKPTSPTWGHLPDDAEPVLEHSGGSEAHSDTFLSCAAGWEMSRVARRG